MAKSPTKLKRDSKGRFKKATPRLVLPHIFRKITAFHPFRWLIGLLLLSILVLQLVQFGRYVYANYQIAQTKQQEEKAIEEQIRHWEEIVVQHPNYRDAYFELAVLTYRINKLDKTRLYLQKVFALDPNFQPARDLEEKL